jgi:hypothetical protein
MGRRSAYLKADAWIWRYSGRQNIEIAIHVLSVVGGYQICPKTGLRDHWTPSACVAGHDIRIAVLSFISSASYWLDMHAPRTRLPASSIPTRKVTVSPHDSPGASTSVHYTRQEDASIFHEAETGKHTIELDMMQGTSSQDRKQCSHL